MSKELETIADKIRACVLCPLSKSRHLAVPGEGDPKARLMLIGEAPGSEEDAQGRPFVGRAGRLLDEVLEAVGLDRREIFITNLVKCRPPNNRIPQKLELNTCMNNYLKRQIELIQPAVIGLLGNTAAKSMLGQRLSDVRAKVIDKDRTYFATYHPAAIARNPSWKKSYIEDFRKLARLIP